MERGVALVKSESRDLLRYGHILRIRLSVRLRDARGGVGAADYVYGLVDTGAETSVLTERWAGLLEQRGGYATRSEVVSGVGKARAVFFPIVVTDFDAPQREAVNLVAGAVAGAKSFGITSSGSAVQMLLGRDFLARFRLVYDGPRGVASYG